MFGLGKKRSKLGEWMDQRGISQEWLARAAGVGRNTVGDLTSSDEKRSPTLATVKKILDALRTVDPNVKSSDFWEM